MIKMGYTHAFSDRQGVGETGPREVPLRAPTCLKLISDALARRSQPMPSTHPSFFKSGTLLGMTKSWRRRGHKDLPFRLQVRGVILTLLVANAFDFSFDFSFDFGFDFGFEMVLKSVSKSGSNFLF